MAANGLVGVLAVMTGNSSLTILATLLLVALGQEAQAKTAGLSKGVDFGPTAQCIDKRIADRLAVKRKRRNAVNRLFVKHARHEFSALGGYYASDLYSGTYVFSGSYTYHMTETTAVEIGAAFTHQNADLIEAIEDGRGSILDDKFASTRFVESVLLWTPVYGKLRLGGSIARFDLHLDAGIGVVDSPTSRGASAVAGLGSKIFFGQAVALRLDLRNHIFRQELLDEDFIVNDVSLTAGLSVFLPFSN